MENATGTDRCGWCNWQYGVPATFVYFVQSDATKLVKIGYTNNVARRLKHFQLGSGDSLRVLASSIGTAMEETAFHRVFAEDSEHGEWFRPSPDLLKTCGNINSGHVYVTKGIRLSVGSATRARELDLELVSDADSAWEIIQRKLYVAPAYAATPNIRGKAIQHISMCRMLARHFGRNDWLQAVESCIDFLCKVDGRPRRSPHDPMLLRGGYAEATP